MSEEHNKKTDEILNDHKNDNIISSKSFADVVVDDNTDGGIFSAEQFPLEIKNNEPYFKPQKPINEDISSVVVDRLKSLGAKIVSSSKYPISGHASEKQTVATDNNPNTNKLATLRKKIAHDIDKTLGTNLEEKKLAKPLKKIEKAISDKLFGKVKE